MNGEFLKILEGKLRQEIRRELASETALPEGKAEPSGMIGFSWLLGSTEVSREPRCATRARSVYGVRIKPPPPRPAHVLTPEQRAAYDRLAALTGLPDNFSKVELKKAWRTAALRTHPDQGGTAEGFRLVQQDYKVLSDI